MIRLLRVEGDSMLPQYRDGDFVLVSKIPILLSRLKPGDVVVLRQATYGTLLKRVERIEPQEQRVFVVGNHAWSVDSRRFGAVEMGDIVGVVIWHVKRPLQGPRPGG
jgi:signal peptidase I